MQKNTAMTKVKGNLVQKVKEEMKKQSVTKSELARRMNTGRSVIDDLLDIQKNIRLDSIVRATEALGKNLELTFR